VWLRRLPVGRGSPAQCCTSTTRRSGPVRANARKPVRAGDAEAPGHDALEVPELGRLLENLVVGHRVQHGLDRLALVVVVDGVADDRPEPGRTLQCHLQAARISSPPKGRRSRLPQAGGHRVPRRVGQARTAVPPSGAVGSAIASLRERSHRRGIRSPAGSPAAVPTDPLDLLMRDQLLAALPVDRRHFALPDGLCELDLADAELGGGVGQAERGGGT
jgi:hypothetical protein